MEGMRHGNIIRPLEPSRASQISSGVFISGCIVYAPQKFVCTGVLVKTLNSAALLVVVVLLEVRFLTLVLP
jgi:hypothetical protein